MIGADHCARLMGLNLSDVCRSGERLAGVLEYGYNYYNYDMVLVFSDPYVEAEAMGCSIVYSPSPIIIGPCPDAGEILDKNREWNFPEDSALNVMIEAARILKRRLKVPIFFSIKGPFSLSSFLYGIEDFLKLIKTAPEKAARFIHKTNNLLLKYIEKVLSLNINIFIGDPMASTSVISPDDFKRFALPPLRVLTGFIKEKDAMLGLHICGNTKPIIKLLDYLGVDILSLEDITPKTRTLRMGGVSTRTIFNDSSEQIKAEVERALKKPPLILSTGCDVPQDTKPENVKSLIKAFYEIGGCK